VQRVKTAAPDVSMQASYFPTALLFMRGYKQQGVNVKAILRARRGVHRSELLEASVPTPKAFHSASVSRHQHPSSDPIDHWFRVKRL